MSDNLVGCWWLLLMSVSLMLGIVDYTLAHRLNLGYLSCLRPQARVGSTMKVDLVGVNFGEVLTLIFLR
jgi:hypothetical protein